MRLPSLFLATFVAMLVGSLAGCEKVPAPKEEAVQPSFDEKAERAAIEKLRDTFSAAIAEKRYGDLQQFVTADAKTVMPACAAWQKMKQLGKERGRFPYDKIEMSPIETVIVNADTAYDFGSSKVYYEDENGEQQVITDTFLVILKKVDGQWKLHREVASSGALE